MNPIKQGLRDHAREEVIARALDHVRMHAREEASYQRAGMTDAELDAVIDTSADMRNLTGVARSAFCATYRDSYHTLEQARGNRQ